MSPNIGKQLILLNLVLEKAAFWLQEQSCVRFVHFLSRKSGETSLIRARNRSIPERFFAIDPNRSQNIFRLASFCEFYSPFSAWFDKVIISIISSNRRRRWRKEKSVGKVEKSFEGRRKNDASPHSDMTQANKTAQFEGLLAPFDAQLLWQTSFHKSRWSRRQSPYVIRWSQCAHICICIPSEFSAGHYVGNLACPVLSVDKSPVGGKKSRHQYAESLD